MPWVELVGAANVRDLGGLATQDGGETVAGRLLRGDNLQELTPSDVARLVADVARYGAEASVRGGLARSLAA